MQTLLAEMPPEESAGGVGRQRILPALALWGGLLVCVLHGLSHVTAVWRLLAERQVWFYPRFPISDEAVYRRLLRAGSAPLLAEDLRSRLDALVGQCRPQ